MPLDLLALALVPPGVTLLALGLAAWVETRSYITEASELDAGEDLDLPDETQDDFTPAMRRWQAMLGRWGTWQ